MILHAAGAAVAIAVSLGLLAAPAVAQSPRPAPLTITEADTSGFPEVELTVQAPATLRGRDLPPGAVRVLENGQERGAQVRRLPVDELEVVLVLDTSGSMGGAPMAAAQGAATAFVAQMPPGVRVAVVGFGGTTTVASGFTDDRLALSAAIARLSASGKTALYDAVTAATALFPEGGASRRALVVLSDGGDTASTATLESAASALAKSGARAYAVQLVSSDSDTASLGRLAQAGQGRVVAADDPAALAGAYAALAEELTSEYVVTYTSQAGGPTDVRVVLQTQAVLAEATRPLALPALPPTAVAEVLPDPGTSWQLTAGAVAVFVAIATLAGTAFSPHGPRVTLTLSAAGGTAGRLGGLAGRAEAAVDRGISSNRRSALNVALEGAGLALRPGELLVLVACAAFGGLAVGFLVGGALLGALLGGLVLLLVRPVLRLLAGRRRAQFAAQLGDTLQLLSGSLRSGYALQQAVDAVARESESPTADEFRRLTTEVRLGRDFREALDALAQRTGSEDFEWVVQAIAINREVGGDLSEVLDRVAETIRERDRLRRQVKALSAEGRLSAIVLFALPLCLVAFISLANPGYLSPLTSTGLGISMSAVATLLMLVGGLWLRRVVRPVF